MQAILAILAFIVSGLILATIGVWIFRVMEERKINKEHCKKFERFFEIHSEAEAEMKKIWTITNNETRNAISAHFGHAINSFIGSGQHPKDRTSDRSVSVRW